MSNNKENAEKTPLEMEREELNLLIKRGVKFDITIGKRKKTFEIHEPTLAVLDRLSDLWLEIAINEEALQEEDNAVLIEAKQLAKANAGRMARIIAVAVLGEDYYTNIPILKNILNVFYRIRLRKLTDLFFHTIKPSKLVALSATVTNMSNLGDFLASMRLMSGARTTQPRKERIE